MERQGREVNPKKKGWVRTYTDRGSFLGYLVDAAGGKIYAQVG